MAESYVIVRAMLIGKIKALDPSFKVQDSVCFTNAGLELMLSNLEKEKRKPVRLPAPS